MRERQRKPGWSMFNINVHWKIAALTGWFDWLDFLFYFYFFKGSISSLLWVCFLFFFFSSALLWVFNAHLECNSQGWGQGRSEGMTSHKLFRNHFINEVRRMIGLIWSHKQPQREWLALFNVVTSSSSTNPTQGGASRASPVPGTLGSAGLSYPSCVTPWCHRPTRVPFPSLWPGGSLGAATVTRGPWRGATKRGAQAAAAPHSNSCPAPRASGAWSTLG